MRHVQALLNWILLSTGRTDLKCLVVVVVVFHYGTGNLFSLMIGFTGLSGSSLSDS